MYRFNLQVVLDYRKRIEEGLQIELSQIQRELEKEKQLFLAYRREKNYYEEELVKREEKEINVNEALLYRDYLRGMRIKIKEQRDIVAKAKGDFDIKQNELLNATKKRKVLEKVKEKEWKRFKENIERRERILVDEVGMRTYQRGM
ncbi:MAG: flagellar export protein FliJ [Deltaproteobacteria bacterium]|jgi:flagellar FliJ protein|nr:flagellar export protein FliJ [Deltaproteobacteria bacterium]